jgi:alkylhydroperoxidase/carboxymuconolactone decarboxylase family protein YurZ
MATLVHPERIGYPRRADHPIGTMRPAAGLLRVASRNHSTEELTMAGGTTETPVLDLLTKLTKDSIEATTLDERTLMLVRLAALVAIDAPPASYLMNLGVATELGIDEKDVQDVLVAVAPVVGTPRIVAATGNIVRALGFAIELADTDD